MRTIWMAATVLAAGAALAGCGKQEAPVMPQAASEAPAVAAAPAGPTPEQEAMKASLPAPYNTADLASGQAKFAQCHSCHTIDKGGANLTGPNLYGVFGTKAAQVAGFDFSDAMKGSGFTWDAPMIDKWIADPRTVLPDTKMTFAGVTDAKDRADIVAFVAVQRDK